MHRFLYLVEQYGYAAVFGLLAIGVVGAPLPDEPMLLYAGFLAFRGELALAGVMCAAVAGSVVGVTLSYGLGRWLGWRVVKKAGKWIHLSEERAEKTRAWFHRTGRVALTMSFFVPGMRHLTAIVAGSMRVEMKTFAMYSWAGGVLWCAVFLTLGYVVGHEWETVGHKIGKYVGGAVAVALVGGLVVWEVRKKRKGKKK